MDLAERRHTVKRRGLTWMSTIALAAGVLAGAVPATGEVCVEDITHLQGEHANRLMGFGLVVGLNGSGDGSKSIRTMRALAALHQRYEQNIQSLEELMSDRNVAIVTVEVETPRHGWRSGQRVDVIVSAMGAKSLSGGQLLTTPLQVAPLTTNGPFDIHALAGGRIDLLDPEIPTRGVIRGGAVMESDYYHTFIDGQYITLVLDEAHAGFPMARMVAQNINQELANPGLGGVAERDVNGEIVVNTDIAVAISPNQVRVRIPAHEIAQPAGFISRVLQTPLFLRPRTPARVVINRTTGQITYTETVTILPTVVQIPGLGTVAVGGGRRGNPASGVAGVSTEPTDENLEFKKLIAALEQLKLPPEQTVQIVEQLHETGTLQAQLIYQE